jgi:hypothetical protein
VQSIGNSLQANAQNVIKDIDTLLGKKLSYTFDRLDATELRLVEDAQALTAQTKKATTDVLGKAGDEARKTIVDADIAAYNAMYALPCRDAPPRVVASFPARLTSGASAPILTLRGNFLRQGAAPFIKVNGVNARIIERLDSAISLEIPSQVMSSARDMEVIVSAVVDGLEEISRSLWAWGLFGCHESKSIVQAKPIGLSVLEPPVRYNVVGTTKYSYTAYREVAEPVQQFANTGSSQCDDNYRVDQQWCISGSGTISRADVAVTSANCNSGFEGTVPSGDRCVLARGKVAGCGADRDPVFHTWLGCKGRGWLKYNITLIRREPYEAETTEAMISKAGIAGERSFSFNMPPAVGLDSVSARYQVQIQAAKGSRIITTVSLSHANPTTGLYSSRVNGGVLSIEVSQ